MAALVPGCRDDEEIVPQGQKDAGESCPTLHAFVGPGGPGDHQDAIAKLGDHFAQDDSEDDGQRGQGGGKWHLEVVSAQTGQAVVGCQDCRSGAEEAAFANAAANCPAEEYGVLVPIWKIDGYEEEGPRPFHCGRTSAS